MTITSRAYDLANYAGSLAWPPVLSVSRGAILALLKNIQLGSLQITDTDGSITICGSSRRSQAESEDEKSVYSVPHAELRVHNDLFWIRMVLFADMGFAESYMLGEVSCSDLTSFFKLFIHNRAYLANGVTLSSQVLGQITSLVRKTNTLTNARLHISAHYDISNDMFAAFLSPDMTYSCPIWLPKTDPKSKNESLESAQHRKLDRFIDNARLKSTDHVLEIGTGWGSLAMRAVQRSGCRVTSLTLSAEQKALADERIAAAGLSDRITVLLCDYRSHQPANGKRYNKIISIEMLEAVGAEFLETYFRCVDQLLDPTSGIAVFQCITMPESRYAVYASSDDFIRRYIFPGGHLPTITQLLDSIRAGSSQTKRGITPQLIPESVENIGPHYAKTLRLWRINFMREFASKIRPALLAEHGGSHVKGRQGGMKEEDVELFRRKWEYYFAYCEAGFATKTLGDVIITVGREGGIDMMDEVPL
jgi:cyclopropane-fatty-acyl-phospholipid synthase